MYTYSQEDWDFDCAPAPQKNLVSDEARAQYILLPSDMALWYIIRLDVMSDGSWFEAGKFVLRPGFAVLTVDRPIKYNTTVILTHRRKPALGSVFTISGDRRFLEEQMKHLENEDHGRTMSKPQITAGDVEMRCEETTASSIVHSVTGFNMSPVKEDVAMEDAAWFSTDSEVEDVKFLIKRRKFNALHHTNHYMQNLHTPYQQHTPSDYQQYQQESPRAEEHETGVNVRGFSTADKTHTEAGTNADLTQTIGVLKGEVHRLTQTLTDMQTRMDSMKLALTVNNNNKTFSYIEGIPSEPTNILNITPNTRSGARSVLSHKNINMTDKTRRSRTKTPSSYKSVSYGSDAEGDSDMVSIGSGMTLIPRQVYSQIDWNSYTIATRKLLMAVFPRRTLATHSLTGKASPAFMSKPAKLRLDTKKVSDIVLTVVENCGVREGLVRSCITTKCADENKMYRMRLQKKTNKMRKSPGDENSPPGPGDSEE